MPELPDVTAYLDALRPRVLNQPVRRVRIASPFLVRSVDPSPFALEGRTVQAVTRMGKRLVFAFDEDLYAVLHLMIAGRLRWVDAGDSKTKIPKKRTLASFEFPHGTLTVTEAGTKKRASLYIERGAEALSKHARGGLDVLGCGEGAFAERLRARNHTLKRALTSPAIFDGIGNAYSDEILHAAMLSPVKWTQRLDDEEVVRLFTATRETLTRWIERLRRTFDGRFPGQGEITAFRPNMAVHGKYGQPCPVCGTKVQRIRYAENETNYCPRCQTGGKLLADRSLSRLLKNDWPKSIDELEELKDGQDAK